jgi:hypothetical protein
MLQGSSFDEHDELLSAIQEILRGGDRQILDVGFHECMVRLQKYLDGNGEYVQ